MDEKIIRYQADSGNEVKLSLSTVRKYLCDNPNVTEQEFMLFAAMCKAHKLDPFIREAYLIKYGSQPAQMQVGINTYKQRAFRNPNFQGYEAGVTIINSEGQITRRAGSMVGGKTERLIGGWCKVYVQGFSVPMFDEVSFEEYAGRKKDGSLNSMWCKMPGTMIRKVAIAHALRDAFPQDLGGLYISEEFGATEPAQAPVEVQEVSEEVPLESYEEPEYEEEF